MMFLKRLFGRKEKAEPEPMHGSPMLQSEAEQEATREHMLAEMEADRERLAERETHPESEPSEAQDIDSGERAG
jgi:hypothetical protein